MAEILPIRLKTQKKLTNLYFCWISGSSDYDTAVAIARFF